MRVDDGGDRVGRIVEAVDELEAKRNQQRDAEQNERADRKALADAFHVRGDAHCRVEQVDRRNDDDMIGLAVCGLSSICQRTAAVTSDIQPTERRPVPY